LIEAFMPIISEAPSAQAAQAFRLDGKVAVVTGGCGGIGSVVSRGLAELGAKIVISDWEADKAADFSNSLKNDGHDSYSVAFNVLSVKDTTVMFDKVAEHYGCVDILVNCVGTQREQPAEEFTEEAFDAVYNVNLKGAMFQAQAAARHMIKQGKGGKQVHMGSVRSLLALRGRGYAAYCATKGGLAILCPAQHQRQPGGADLRSHSTGRTDALGLGVLQPVGNAHSTGPASVAERCDERDRIPCVACVRLHYGSHPVRRRRLDDPLAARERRDVAVGPA
jgi:NADP-dependent 3-hydroxy acid dehydrogenase YdfG